MVRATRYEPILVDDVYYLVRWNAAAPGRPRVQKTKRFPVDAYDEAKAFLLQQLSQRGTTETGDKITLASAIDEWLASKTLRPTTRAAHTAALAPAKARLGKKAAVKVTKADVVALRDAQAKTWAASYVNKMLRLLTAVYDDLAKQGVQTVNPAKIVDRLPTTKQQHRTLSDNDIQDLYKVVTDRQRLAFLHLANLGLRRGEVAGLRWSDFHSGAIRINGQVVVVNGKTSYQPTPKTKAGRRKLPLPAATVDALNAWRAESKHAKDTDYVFTGRSGSFTSPNTFNLWWTDARKAASLPPLRLHDLRHSCASRLVSKGMPLPAVAKWLGHESSAFTLATYAHASDEDLDQLAAAL